MNEALKDFLIFSARIYVFSPFITVRGAICGHGHRDRAMLVRMRDFKRHENKPKDIFKKLVSPISGHLGNAQQLFFLIIYPHAEITVPEILL